jgi:hypothetical protein
MILFVTNRPFKGRGCHSTSHVGMHIFDANIKFFPL